MSNFHINAQKSVAMNLTFELLSCSLLQSTSTIRWAADQIEYLGFLLPRDLTRLNFLNFSHLLKDIQTDLGRCHKGMYTWMDRCRIVKQNILLRLLYHLQALPIYISTTFFRRCFKPFLDLFGHTNCLEFNKLCCTCLETLEALHYLTYIYIMLQYTWYSWQTASDIRTWNNGLQ